MNNDNHGQGKGAVSILDVRFLRNLNLKSMALSFFFVASAERVTVPKVLDNFSNLLKKKLGCCFR